MSKAQRTNELYRRGRYWLAWDRAKDGSLRSPYLAIWWYDSGSGRNRSASTRTSDVDQGKSRLDAHYLEHERGEAICPTCGAIRNGSGGYLVTNAIADYQIGHGDTRTSAKAISARLAHVIEYIGTLSSANITCEQIDVQWVNRFRLWSAKQPVFYGDKQRVRALSTIEASVAQLAAAINFSHGRRDAAHPAAFKAAPMREVNRTPQHRSDVAELIRMFKYAVEKPERASLKRFLQISVATLARPDAAHDLHVGADFGQWNSNARTLNLNPKGRRQTTKYRATVPIARQIAPLLDGAKGRFVGVGSVRKAWEAMAVDLKLPVDREAGMKLIRRSIANELRRPIRAVPLDELEMMLGHRPLDSVSEIYAPFDPAYCANAKAAIETIIDEISVAVPTAFHRSDTGKTKSVTPIRRTKNG
jgi:hypothetical protein